MRIILLSFLFSFNAYAEGLATFDKYKENLPLLSADILRMDSVVQKNNSPIYSDMLTSMTLFKNNFDHLSNPLSLETFHNDAKEKGWKNIERMTGVLISFCESSTSQNLFLCKSGLEDIKSLALNSKLSAENKDAAAIFIDDYLVQLAALSTINSDFVLRFNKNAEFINQKIKEVTANNPPTVVKAAPIPSTAFLTTGFDFQNQKGNILLFVFSSLLFSLAAFYYLKAKGNKVIKDFYLKLFTLGKKNNLHLKVFGKLAAKEAKLISKIQMPFLNTVYLSRSVSNKTQIKFKDRSNKLLIEVNYLTSRAFQNVMNQPKEKALKESVEVLQGIVETNGGEFIFSSRFNSLGELVQSSLILHLPKRVA